MCWDQFLPDIFIFPPTSLLTAVTSPIAVVALGHCTWLSLRPGGSDVLSKVNVCTSVAMWFPNWSYKRSCWKAASLASPEAFWFGKAGIGTLGSAFSESPEWLSASKPLFYSMFPVGFQTLAHQWSLFPPPTQTDRANKGAVFWFHINLKSLISPIWLWEGMESGGWP